MSDFGLPEPVRELTEVDRELLRWNRENCQDAHLSLLSPDEQRVIFDEVMNAVQNERPLLMYRISSNKRRHQINACLV